MALIAPDSVDVTDIQFKLQSKVKIFDSNLSVDLNNLNLLAAASNQGLVFSGSTDPDLHVIQLSSLSNGPKQNAPVARRIVSLPSRAKQIAVNCDHSLLALDVTKNGQAVIQIYLVSSFYENEVTCTHEIQIHGSCHSSQLLWNPVTPNILAVVTESGGLIIYTLKSAGFELCTLDGQDFIQSACWSPKGKQIVGGFINGKLIQFKPDLKPAKTIPAPGNILTGDFDTLAIQWLATYQFAAVFQNKTEESTPTLFIINAPKTGTLTYINYEDLCYSQSGPRKAQVFLNHILPWSLLIVASANSMEIGILGTMEQGDFPTWKQFVPLDNARAEFPLNERKQETYPLGMCLETGVTHQVTISETTFSVMPMIHLLSTDGLLISFNLLNTIPNAPSICSPPNLIQNKSGLAHFTVPDLKAKELVSSKSTITTKTIETKLIPGGQNATSTPTSLNPKSLFGNNHDVLKPTSSLFGANSKSTNEKVSINPPTATLSAFDFGSSNISTFGNLSKMNENKQPNYAFSANTALTSSQPTSLAQPVKQGELNKPLITVPPTYTPVIQTSKNLQSKQQSTSLTDSASTGDQLEEVNIVQALIREEIEHFKKDLAELISRSKSIQINIGSKEEFINMAKEINQLSKLDKEANEVNKFLSSDVNSLRISLNETFAMTTEAKNKNKLFKEQNHLFHQNQYSMSQTSKRQIDRLESMLKINEAQLNMIIRQVDAQWADYQDRQKQQHRNTMKIPSFESIYQTLSKQRDILTKQKNSLNSLKNRVGLKDTIRVLGNAKKDPVESLTDSILSMSIIDQVQMETEKLSAKKIEILKETLKNHKTYVIKAHRPNRVGISSEVVQEKRENLKNLLQKMKTEKKIDKKTGPLHIQKDLRMSNAFSSSTTPIIDTQITKPLLIEKPIKSDNQFSNTSSPSIQNYNMTKPIAQKPTQSAGFASTNSSTSFQTEKPKFSFAELTPQTSVLQFGTTAESPKGSSSSLTSSTISFNFKKLDETQKDNVKSISEPTKQTSTEISFGSGMNVKSPFETKSEKSLLFNETTITPIAKPQEVVATEKVIQPETKPSFSFSSGNGLFTNTTNSTTNNSNFNQFIQNSDNDSKEKQIKSPLENLIDTVTDFQNISSTSETPKEFSLFSNKIEKSVEKNELIKPTAQFSFASNSGNLSNNSNNENDSSKNVQKSLFSAVQSSHSSELVQNNLAEKPSKEVDVPNIVTSPGDDKLLSNFNFSSAAKNLNISSNSSDKTTSVASTTISNSSSFNPPVNTSVSKPSIFNSITSFSVPESVSSTSVKYSETGLFGNNSIISNTKASTTTASLPAPSTTSNNSKADGLFSSFNICTPSNSNKSTPDDASNIFGASTGFTNQSTTSIFGDSNKNGNTQSIFGTSTGSSTQTQTGSIFGSTSKPVFGNSSASSVFGSNSSSSPFGQTQNPSSIFGGGTVTSSQVTSPFGGNNVVSTNTSLFSESTTTASPPFGGNTNAIPFAQQPASPFTGGSLFGNNSSFGSTPTKSFGFSQQTQQPVFGGTATFGSPTGFGSAFAKPTFGGAPTFGQKTLFGSPTQSQATSSVQSNSLFEQLGSQNTGMTFGNLAQNSSPHQQQQQQPQQQLPPPSFGGSAFSSWR
uniref:CSON000134 protein n=1 Tax=Culicoides sonorensis TaxID=179676 RepID=A0A336M1X1_CULSO